MEQYIIHLFYLSILLSMGIIITVFTHSLRLSNILFLIIAGYLLKVNNLDFVNDTALLVLGSLALIMIVLETTMTMDLRHIVTNFLHVIKFSIVYFIVCVYSLTIIVFQYFGLPGKEFEIFALCILLSIIMYGVDPLIAMEFFSGKTSKAKDMLKMEGIISGPLVVVFSFFIIDQLTSSTTSLSSGFVNHGLIILQQVLLGAIISVFFAFILYKVIVHFELTQELLALSIMTVGILVFSISELSLINGSLSVALYGLFLRELLKKPMTKKYNTVIAHTLYIIVFILFGMQFVFPQPIWWFKGGILFLIFLLLRFICVFIMYRDLTLKEQFFITFNVAKGIEVAIVLFIIQLNFSHVEGVHAILSLGYLFFFYSYIFSTVVNHFSALFLETNKKKRKT